MLSSGCSALSPSGNLIAITNLIHGIDWYSVPERQHKCTTTYTYEHLGGTNFIFELEFLDENTVITGSGQSQLMIASYGMTSSPYILEIPDAVIGPPCR